jgi:hypothetical protein
MLTCRFFVFDTLSKVSPQRGEGFDTLSKASPQRGEGFDTLSKASPQRGEGFDTLSKGSPQRGEGFDTLSKGSGHTGKNFRLSEKKITFFIIFIIKTVNLCTQIIKIYLYFVYINPAFIN